MRSNATLIGPVLLCLTLLCTGCATQRIVVPCKPTIQCPHPEIDPSTNAGLAEAVLQYQEALDQCNALNAAVPAQDANPSLWERIKADAGSIELSLPDWFGPDDTSAGKPSLPFMSTQGE